jgi:MFS transporter, YNFM family, putative membrane transport protein
MTRFSASQRGTITAAAAGFTAFVNVYALQSLLPVLAEVFQADSSTVSLAVSATTFAVALASPFAGWLVGRMTRGGLTRLSVGGLVFCGLQAALAGSLETLVLWRFLQGLFLPILIAGVLSFMAQDFAREQLSRATSNYVTWTIVGGFSGRWLAGAIAESFGWREALVGLALANACAGAVLLTTLPDPSSRLPSRQTPRVNDFFRSLNQPSLRAVYLIGFGSLFTMVGGFTYVTFYLSAEPFRLGPEELGNVFFVYLLGITITPMIGRALSRWGYSATIGGTTRLAMVGLLLTLVPNLGFVIVGLSMLCVAGFGTQASASSFIARLDPGERSVAAGLYLSAYYVGGSLGAFIPGLAWQSVGWVGCVGLLLLVQWRVFRLRTSLA